MKKLRHVGMGILAMMTDKEYQRHRRREPAVLICCFVVAVFLCWGVYGLVTGGF